MPRRTTPLLSEATDEYLTNRATHVAPTTLQNDTYTLTALLKGLGDVRVGTLTNADVEAWFRTEADRLTPNSFNKQLDRVRGFFKFAERRKWTDGLLTSEVRPRRVTKRDRLRLSPAQLLDLPNYATELRDKTLLILAANTALRASEIADLRVRDVDLQGGWLQVRVQKSALEDVMPMTAELEVALRVWLSDYQGAGDDYLFPTRKAGRNFYEGGVLLGYVHGPLVPNKPMLKGAVIVQRALEAAGHPVEKGDGCCAPPIIAREEIALMHEVGRSVRT